MWSFIRLSHSLPGSPVLTPPLNLSHLAPLRRLLSVILSLDDQFVEKWSIASVRCLLCCSLTGEINTGHIINAAPGRCYWCRGDMASFTQKKSAADGRKLARSHFNYWGRKEAGCMLIWVRMCLRVWEVTLGGAGFCYCRLCVRRRSCLICAFLGCKQTTSPGAPWHLHFALAFMSLFLVFCFCAIAASSVGLIYKTGMMHFGLQCDLSRKPCISSYL